MITNIKLLKSPRIKFFGKKLFPSKEGENMPIKGYTDLKNKPRFCFLSIIPLALIILISPGISNYYVLAQESPSAKESFVDKILEDQMQQLKSRIWKLDERIEKNPGRTFLLDEIINLREKYLNLLENYIKRQENQLEGNPDNVIKLEKCIELLEEKGMFYREIKENYIELIETNAEMLDEINRILHINPKRITGMNIELVDASEICEYITQLKIMLQKKEERTSPVGKQLEEVSFSDHERLIENIRNLIITEKQEDNKSKEDKILLYDRKILETKNNLFQLKKRYVNILVKKIGQLKSNSQRDINDTERKKKIDELRQKCVQIINECIQEAELKLKKHPEDKILINEIKELKEQKDRINKTA
jgi:hypothetical protein